MPEKTGITSSLGLDMRPAYRQIEALANHAERRFSSVKTLDSKNFTRPLGQISAALSDFDKSLHASTARVLAFGATTGIIYSVSQAFKEMVLSTVKVEKALADINVILGLSSNSLKQFKDGLFEISRSTAQSFDEVAKAATEFSRQGLGMEDTLRRTRDALILTRLSGLDAVSSVEALTAAINSFSNAALNSTEIINKLANVDAAFAVSSADLAEAIKRVGSSAQDVGVDIDALIGIVTSAQQTTARGGAVIGTALKSIFTRVQRPEVLAQLEKLGLTVRDLAGNTRPALQILEDLAKGIEHFNDAQKSQIEESVGSVYQINILKATLSDLSKEYSVYNKARQISASADDQAVKRNEELNKTLAALIDRTKANLTQLGSALGEASISPLIKNVLGEVNNAIEAFAGDSSKGLGSSLGKGIVNGIGEFITGPGLILIGAAVFKLVAKFSADIATAFKSVLSLDKTSKESLAVQTRINEVLAQNPQLVAQVYDKTNQLLTVEQKMAVVQNQVLTIIKQENLERQKSIELAQKLTASSFASGNKNVIINNSGGKKASGGLIPNFASEFDKIQEKMGAIGGGYAPGQIREMYVKGMGMVTYNSNERVKDFGMEQPAIMPPQTSKAGQNYKKVFKDKHGVDPYAASGVVPNFARMADKFRVIDARGFVKPSETMGVGMNAYLQGAHKDALDGFKGESLDDLIEHLLDVKPAAIDDAITKGLMKKAAKGLVPNFANKGERLLMNRLSDKFGKSGFESHYGGKGQFIKSRRADQGKLQSELRYNFDHDYNPFGPEAPNRDLVLPKGVSNSNVFSYDEAQKAIKIHYLSNPDSDPKQARALFKYFQGLVKRKQVDYINAGAIVGEKVPPLLARASKLLGVPIKGMISGDALDSANIKGHKSEYLNQINAKKKEYGYDYDFEVFPNAFGGLVPNFAPRKLGEGLFSEFYDTGKKLGGVPVGYKKFHPTSLVQNSIRRDYRNSEKLAQSGLPEVVQIPKIFGNLQRSLARKKVGKEVISGLTGTDFVGSLPEKLQNRADKILAGVSLFLEDNISAIGINPKDLHYDNFMLNNEAVKEFKSALKDSKRVKELSDPKTRSKAYASLAKKGGRFAIVDPGEFREFSNGLAPAIAREQKAGKPLSKIRIDSSSQLASANNPLGLGVYNTQDEPNGLQQGISRALREGMNPKTYGAANGLIPNFAKEFEVPDRGIVKRFGMAGFQDRDESVATISKEVNKEWDVIKQKLRKQSVTLDEAFAEGKKLVKNYGLAAKEIEYFQRSAKSTVQMQKKFEEKERKTLKGPINPSVIPVTSQINAPKMQASEAYLNDLRRLNPLAPPIYPNDKAMAPYRAMANAKATQPLPSTSLEFEEFNKQKKTGFTIPITKFDLQQEKIQSTLDFAKLSANANRADRGVKAAGTFGSFVPFTSAFNDARFAKQQNREGFNASRDTLNNRLTAASFGVSFAAPVLSNVIQQNIGQNTQSQRTTGAVVGALGNTASFAAAGLPFGPTGAAVGAGLGILSSLPDILNSINDELPEFERSLGAIRDSVSQSSEAMQGFIRTNETLASFSSGKTKLTPENAAKLEQDRLNFLNRLSPERQDEVVKTKSQSELRSLVDKFAIEDSNKLRAAESKALIKSFEKDIGFGFFGNKTLTDDKDEVVGTREFNAGAFGGVGGAPSTKSLVFGKKLSEEASAQFSPTKGLILGSQGANKKTLIQSLIDSPEIADQLRASIGKGDEFFGKLEKLGQTSDNSELLRIAGFLRNTKDEELKSATTKEFTQVLSSDNLQRLKDRSIDLQGKDETRVRTTAEFQDALLDAIITINKFQSDLETTNDIALNKFSQGLERSRIGEQSNLAEQEFFKGPKAIAQLQNEIATAEIFRRQKTGKAQASTTFDNSFNSLISQGSAQFLQSRFNSGATGDEFNLADSQKKAFEFFGLGDFVGNLKKQTPEQARGTLNLTDAKIDGLINSLNSKAGGGGTLTKDEQDQLSFLGDIKKALKSVSEDYVNSVKKVEAATKEELRTQELINKGNNKILSIQEKLNIGGGVGNILSSSRSAPSSASDISFLANQKDNSARTSGLFQFAKTADLQGAEIGSSIREELVNGLAQELQVNAKAFGVNISDAFAKDVARTQVNAEFKTGKGTGPIIGRGQIPQDRLIANAPDELQVREQLRRITVDEEATHKSIAEVNRKINDLRTANAEKGVSALQTEREIQVVLAEEAKILADQAYQRKEISGAQLQQLQAAQSGAKIEAGVYGLNDALVDFQTQFQYNIKDFYTDVSQGAVDMGKTLKGSFGDAFKSFADGSKSASEAWRSFALSVAGKLSDKTIDIAVNTLFNAGAGAIGSFFNKGGAVKRFSSGGPVVGGSGTKDDVPALLSEGEYVLRRSAVQRIGEKKLAALNGGKDASFLFNNRYDYDSVTSPTMGQLNVNSLLSAEALDDPNNPQNRIRQEMEEDLLNYLRERKGYNEQKDAAMKQYRRGLNQQLASAYISAGITVGGAAIKGYGAGKYTGAATRKNYVDSPYNKNIAGSSGVMSAALGGPVRGYNAGGGVFGGESAIDNIPAMLTGGEFVVRKDVVQKHGADFFNRLNNGQAQGFNAGGLVGGGSGAVAGGDGFSESFNRLISIAENINQAIREKDDSGEKDAEAALGTNTDKSNGTTNNYFSFNITIDKSGGVESATSSGNGEESKKDNSQSEDMRKLSEVIKNECIKVIIKEQRPGGLLTEQQKR